jgi:putative transposase
VHLLPKAELLNGEPFYSLAEARIVIESWRLHYNTQRPHSSLGYKPPAPPTVLWPAAPPSTIAAKPTMH